jgi:hypothetical protein
VKQARVDVDHAGGDRSKAGHEVVGRFHDEHVRGERLRSRFGTQRI